MTREEMLAQINSQLSVDVNVIIIMRSAIIKNLPNVDDDTLTRLYYALNPPPSP